jgi:hypothetical protein
MMSFEAAALVLTFAGSSALAAPVLTGALAPSPDAAVIANLTDMYLKASVGATTTGKWLDAAAGNPPGQSLIIPGTTVVGPNPGRSRSIASTTLRERKQQSSPSIIVPGAKAL